MGNLFSNPKPKLVAEDEKTWDINNHATNIETATEEDVSCFRDKSKLYLCYKICKSLTTDLEYKLYIITDKKIKFGIMNHNESGLSAFSAEDKSEYIEDAVFKLNKDVRRRIMLLAGPGKFNFSHGLRNSEHVARYIHSGAWISYQMTEASQLRQLFKSYMSQDQIKLINVHPEELAPNDEGSLEVMYEEARDHAQYGKQTLLILDEDNDAHNILILGPTGSGKSAIVNQLYNKQVVLSKSSPNSVTRKVQYTQGSYNGKSINIVDTIGMCDTVLRPDQVYNVVKDSVKANMVYIDKVVIVCYGRIQKDHKDSIGKFMEWLRYTNYKTNFVFVYNKQEGIPTAERSQHLITMCEELGVDMNKDEIVSCPDGSRRSIKFTHSLGIKAGTPWDDVETELTEFKRAVLSRTKSRIKVPLGTFDNRSTNPSICTII